MAEQSLTVKVEAKGVGDLGAPFKKLKDGAKEAHLSLQSMSAGAGRVKESIEGIKSGLLGLSVSSNLLPASIGKAANALNALGSAAALLKGVGGLGSGLVGAVGGGPLALLAGGITALGSAAVLASPKLQESLGKALLNVTGDAEAMEAALKRAQDRLDDIRSARSLGVGTEKEEAQAALRLSVAGPRREQQQALGLEKVRQLARAGALQQFPDTDFDIFGPQLQEQLKPGKFRENADFLREAAAGPQMIPAELIRQEMVAKAEQEELGRRDREARERLADVQEREALTRRHGQAGKALEAVKSQITAEQNRGSEAQSLGFFLRTQALGYTDQDLKATEALKRSGRSNFLDQQLFGYFDESGGGAATPKLIALQKEKERLEREQASAQNALNGRKFVTSETELTNAVGQQEAAASRLRESNAKLLEVKQKINQAELDGLKLIQKQVAEQQKLAEAAVKEEEAKLKGLKSSLGLEDRESVREQLTVARKIAGGKQLSDEEIKSVRGQEIFREALEKIGLQRTDQDKDRQELLRLLGADRKLQEAKQAQEELVKLDATVKHEIRLKVEANAGETAAEITKQVVPEIEKSIGDLSRNIEALIELKINAALQKARTQERDARNAAGGG